MASTVAYGFLPTLDKCLDGTSQLLSWQSAYLSLRDSICLEEDGLTEKFLSDAKVQDILKRFRSPFPPPSAQTRSTFDSLTSAINAPASTNGKHDIKQVKDDALWLSKEVGIDEVVALRIVVLELQQRPEDRLLRDVAEVESESHGRSFRQSSLLRSVLGDRQYNHDLVDYDTDTARHVRLLGLLLSEKQYVAKIREMIGYTKLSKTRPTVPDWLYDIGESLVTSWFDGAGNFSTLFTEIQSGIQECLKSLRSGCRWLQNDETQDSGLVTLWYGTTAAELMHIMQILLHLLNSRTELAPAKVVTLWFDVMAEYQFFVQFDMICTQVKESQIQALQNLAALISVAVLRIDLALYSIPELAVQAVVPDSHVTQAYLGDTKCVESITTVLLSAGDNSLPSAGPAIFTWGLICQTLRSYARESIDARESRQVQRTLEHPVHTTESDADSVDVLPTRDRRRSSFGSDNGQPQTLAESIMDTVQRVAPNDDPIHLLGKCIEGLATFETISALAIDFCTPYGAAFGGQVGAEQRGYLLDVLSASLIWMEYAQDMIEAFIAVLSGGQSAKEIQNQCSSFQAVHPIKMFLEDERCCTRVLQIAAARFPLESGPLLALGQLLAHITTEDSDHSTSRILSMLKSLHTLTTKVDAPYANWTLEDMNDMNYVKLTTPLDVFAILLDDFVRGAPQSGRKYLAGGSTQLSSFILPEGTLGLSLTEEKPIIAMWNLEYSGLAYTGLLIQYALKQWPSDQSSAVHQYYVSIISDSLNLLNSLLLTSSSEQAIQILGDFSDPLNDNTDIVQIFFEMFESLLYRRQGDESATELLVSCIELLRTLLKVVPGRVWPFLGRSGLLGIDKSESRLRVIVAADEITSGRFHFLLGNVCLFEELVNDAVTHSIMRKASSKALARFAPLQASATGAGVTETVMKRILTQFQSLMLDIFESCRAWRFLFLGQRMEITTALCRVFNMVLACAYDIDDDKDISKKVTGFFAPLATQLNGSFLVPNTNNSICAALLQVLLEGLQTPIDTTTPACPRFWIHQTVSALDLAQRLLSLRVHLGQSPAVLEEGLFETVPTLIKLYMTHPNYRLPVLVLLNALVDAADCSNAPPSLLAHLSTGAATSFLRSLHKLDRPFRDDQVSAAIWRLSSASVSKRQRWLSIYLLTGSTPRDNLKAKAKSEVTIASRSSMLDTALTRAASIPRLAPEEAVPLLEFLALAADFWPWVVGVIRNTRNTMDALLDFLSQMESIMNQQDNFQEPVKPLQVQMLAHILDIMALIIHLGTGDTNVTLAKSLILKTSYLMEHGTADPAYNSSLHNNLSRNFTRRFECCEPIRLKRSSTATTNLGPSFYYHLGIADLLLSYDSAWLGSSPGGGFRAEIVRANINLSVVEAEINIFHSWKSLLIELVNVLQGDSDFRIASARIIRNCLDANKDNALPQKIFQRFAQSRADLGYILLQFIVPNMKNGDVANRILNTSWDVVRQQSADVSMALSEDDAEYYRTSLKILYLALQPQLQELPLDARHSVYSAAVTKPTGIDAALLEVTRLVVARGFSSLISLLHDDPTKVLPADLALLTAILHTILYIPSMESHHDQLLNIFADEKTPVYASTLFSWADKLMLDGDPIYGEISIGFLVEMSALPSLAEVILTCGCLAQLGTSRLAKAFSRGSGPFEQPARVYSIWTKGMLPLVINLLTAVGPLIAADIVNFLNQFVGQMERAVYCLESKASKSSGAGLITLSMATEAHSLALISNMLIIFKEAGASAGIVSSEIADLAWDRSVVKETIEDRLQRRIALREAIVPTDEKEETWAAMKTSENKYSAENLLEQKVVELLSGTLEMLGPGDL